MPLRCRFRQEIIRDASYAVGSTVIAGCELSGSTLVKIDRLVESRISLVSCSHLRSIVLTRAGVVPLHRRFNAEGLR